MSNTSKLMVSARTGGNAWARGLAVCLWLGLLIGAAHAQSIAPDSAGTTSYSTVDGEFVQLRPQFLSANELAKALQLAMGQQGSLAVLDSQDTVLVAGSPEALRRAVSMMHQVDTPRWQVRLAIYLFDVELNELKQLGLAATAQTKSSSQNPTTEPNQFHVLSSQLELHQTLKLLNECSGAKLIADPQLTAVDRQTASFNALNKVPGLLASSSERSGTNAATGYEEVGVKLAITPRIASAAQVELRIAPQFSSIIGFNNQGSPIIESRGAETTVRVANGQTLVIGGLRRRTSVEVVQSASLMNRKVVEPLFRASNADPTESELICIVRPEILVTPALQSPVPTAQATAMSAANQSVPPYMAARTDGPTAVQNGAYQEPVSTPSFDEVKPSAYRPSVYNKSNKSTSQPRRNINTSRNSVTQPLVLPSKMK